MTKQIFDSLPSRLFAVAVFAVLGLAGVAGLSEFDAKKRVLGERGGELLLTLNQETVVEEGAAVVLTPNGNSIPFLVNAASQIPNGFLRLEEGGFLKNATAISGLARLAIVFAEGEANSLILSYGWDEECAYATGILLSPDSPTSDLDSLGPSFFKIGASASVTISSISIAYSCLINPAPTYKKDGVTYVLSDDRTSYMATQFDGSVSSLSLPSSLFGVPVISLGNDFLNGFGSKVTALSLPASITTLGSRSLWGCQASGIDLSRITRFGEYALSGCTKLLNVTLHPELTVLPDYVFNNCTRLSAIFIPLSVRAVGHYAFYRCSSLSIRCAVSSQPSTWDSGWNPSSRPVIWGAME